MNMFFNASFYPKNFILLGTDRDKLTERVSLISNEANKRFASEFTGECLHFPFQLRYSAPYERFSELKRMQVEARNHVRFKSDYCGYIVLELNDFLSHEEEDYFDITVKFLHDQMEVGWKYIFIVDNTNQRSASLMIKKILSFLRCKVEVVNEPVLNNSLDGWVSQMSEKHSVTLSIDAKSELEPLFKLKSFDKNVGEVLMDELVMMYGEKRVLIQSEVSSYLSSQLSSIKYMVAENDYELFMSSRDNKKEYSEI